MAPRARPAASTYYSRRVRRGLRCNAPGSGRGLRHLEHAGPEPEAGQPHRSGTCGAGARRDHRVGARPVQQRLGGMGRRLEARLARGAPRRRIALRDRERRGCSCAARHRRTDSGAPRRWPGGVGREHLGRLGEGALREWVGSVDRRTRARRGPRAGGGRCTRARVTARDMASDRRRRARDPRGLPRLDRASVGVGHRVRRPSGRSAACRWPAPPRPAAWSG